jgi:aerobic-type carbon monoxide dehydrogenase small subunit (CoxS/CutS family)
MRESAGRAALIRPGGNAADEDRHALIVNGEARSIEAGARTTLGSALRDQLGLTSVKLACERGECGACTVLVDGLPRMSCITLARLAGEVVTLEGLAGESADLRAAFADAGAFQCGFCTPGQVVHATAILSAGLSADAEERRDQVRRALVGNICRCTGYQGIVDAICTVAAGRKVAS